MWRTWALAGILALAFTTPAVAAEPVDWEKAAAFAARSSPMTANEADAFIRRLAAYVEANHLKKDPNSPQRGMVYEYFDTTRKGQFDQWVQGEALDTMHDGAWLAMAMSNAHRATGDKRYRDFLVKWQLPFYTRVLNDSDKLFDTKQVDVAEKGVRFNLEHALQPGEKGFCPYWWDDGASVSLERRRFKDPLGKLKDPFEKPPFACTDLMADQPNPQALLMGYSHGSSNHLAQDLGPMLMLGWLQLHESPDAADRKLADDCARAAKNLQECRTRHGFPGIPAVVGPAALTNNDAALMKRLGGEPKLAPPSNHYTRFLGGVANPDQRHSTPGFMDDAEYTYYAHLARTGGKLPPAVLFKLVYDCYTEPMLFRYWSDDAPVLPGINRFDLIGHYGKGGRFESYRSDRKVPVGSRFGPQNMVVCAWALQALDANPGLWDKAVDELCGKDVRLGIAPREKEEVASFDLDGAKIELRISRTELHAKGTFQGNELKLDLFGGPDGKGPKTSFLLKGEGRERVTAVNGDGEPLTIPDRGTVSTGSDLKSKFDFRIPFTVVKDQGRWMNPVLLGRYSLVAKGQTRNFVLVVPESLVKWALRRELENGLRVWEAILDAKGYIPTGMGAGGDWDKFSDSGGYAHLISAASQYRIWKAGKRDWDLHAVPVVK
jgi:hypothetical protein